MSRHSSRFFLTLVLAIAASPLLAAPSPRTATPRAPVAVQAMAPSSVRPFAQLWRHLTSLWGALGCGIDPNGIKCASSTTQPTTITATTPTDLGCGLDPDGAH